MRKLFNPYNNGVIFGKMGECERQEGGGCGAPGGGGDWLAPEEEGGRGGKRRKATAKGIDRTSRLCQEETRRKAGLFIFVNCTKRQPEGGRLPGQARGPPGRILTLIFC
jgi:hypothetical protein